MPKLSVHLVAWNGAKYIPYLFESLRAQTYKDWEMLAIDNGSKDDTADLVEQELKNFPVPARLIRNKENNGFAGGHNQAIRVMAKSREHRARSIEGDSSPTPYALRPTPPEYIQLLNQDMYLAPDYFARVVAMMDAHGDAGAGQGLLLKWNFQELSKISEISKVRIKETLSDVVDTMGLRVMRNRRVIDWKTGKQANKSLSGLISLNPYLADAVEVFGVSGALPIYRREAIEVVAFEGNMFDDEFVSYKEDVDLALRLRAAGWKAYVAAAARAWHDRTAAGPREMSDKAALSNRKGRAAYVNYYSYRNHLVVLLKNEHRANFAKDWLWIMWYEFKKFVYLLFTDWTTLKGLREVWRLRKRIMEKRKHIMVHFQVRPEEIRRWFVAD